MTGMRLHSSQDGKPNVRNIERNVSWLLLLALTLMLTAQIIARYVFYTSINWIEEFSRIVFVWFIYLSISWIIIQGRHIRVTALDMILPDLWKSSFSIFADSLWLLFNIVMTYYGFLFVWSEIENYSETDVLEIPEAIVHGIIPVGFALMTIRLAFHMYRVYILGGPEVLYQTEKLDEEV